MESYTNRNRSLKNALKKMTAVSLLIYGLNASSLQGADDPATTPPAVDPAAAAPAAPPPAGTNDPVPASPTVAAPVPEAVPPNVPDSAAAAAATPPPAADTTTTDSNGKLQSFVEAKESKKFVGRPITVQVKEAELADVFRLVAEASGFNIIVGEDVKGKITLSLIDVPWDQALDVILHTKQLGAERNNNILRIVTLVNLTQEKQAEISAKKASEATAPRITQIFPISYADIKELSKTLQSLASSSSEPDFGGGTGGAGGGRGASSSGSGASSQIIQTDERTNSIIVRDLPENIERMKKIVEMLDTQTPQVMIEAKIIEANEDFAKNINGSIGFAGSNFGTSMAGNGAANTLLGDVSKGAMFKDGAGLGETSLGKSGASGVFALAKPVSFISGITSLSALLNLGESEHQLRILTSPKIVVQNKVAASVESSEPVQISKPLLQNGVSLQQTEVVSAKIGMQVTPTVTNNNNVILDLTIQRGYPNGAVGVSDRTMKTKVVVESGVTLVIGGIYTVSKDVQSSGFPFLRKIPIIGALFGSESETNTRKEIFIFVTPRILNEVESGLAG